MEEGREIFFNTVTNSSDPRRPTSVRGGVLADDMGAYCLQSFASAVCENVFKTAVKAARRLQIKRTGLSKLWCVWYVCMCTCTMHAGLGKTLQVLALIAIHPPSGVTYSSTSTTIQASDLNPDPIMVDSIASDDDDSSDVTETQAKKAKSDSSQTDTKAADEAAATVPSMSAEGDF